MGNDDIQGNEGDDKIDSGDGNDLLRGGSGADVLNAGGGHDTLVGGAGSDRLNGGSGEDYYTFVGDWSEDRLTDTGGRTTVDFSEVTVTLETNLSGRGRADFTSGSNSVSVTRADIQVIKSQLDVLDLQKVSGLGTDPAINEKLAAQLSALAANINQLQNDLNIAIPDLNNKKIEATDATLNEIFGISDYLDLGVYIEHYLHPILNPDQPLPADDPVPVGTDTPSIEGFLDYLEANWFTNVLGGEGSGDKLDLTLIKNDGGVIIGITLRFEGDGEYTHYVPVGISEPVQGIGPAFVDIDTRINANFVFEFEINWTDGSEKADWSLDALEFDLNVDPDVDLDGNPIPKEFVLPLMIGQCRASDIR